MHAVSSSNVKEKCISLFKLLFEKIIYNFKNERESYHRPLTFIIAEYRTMKATSDALFQGKTFVWFHDLIIGKEENLHEVASENLSIISEGYNSDGMFSAEKLLKIKLQNIFNKMSLKFQAKQFS